MSVLVVVSTCPRQGVNYLPATLRALDKAGARDLPKIVLSDGPLVGPCEWLSLQQLHPFPSSRWNLQDALRLARYLDVERLLFFEDDVVPCRNAVSYMAKLEVPEDVAFVTFHDMKELPPGTDSGLYKIPIDGRGFWGNQALLFRDQAINYFALQNFMSFLTDDTTRHGDRVLEVLTANLNLQIGVHIPCLVRHIGAVSVAHPESPIERLPSNYLNDDFDALSIFNTVT